MSSKFMKSAVLGTATLLVFGSLGSKTADKPADSGSSEAKELTLYVDDGYKSYIEEVKLYEKKKLE